MFGLNRIRVALAALPLVVGMVGVGAIEARADLLDCSQPVTTGADPTAVDCLFVLQVAVGVQAGDPECVNAPKGSVPAVATDALICLQRSVSLVGDEALNCPCGGRVDLKDAGFAFDPGTIANADIQDGFTATDYIGAFEQGSDPAAAWTRGWTIEVHGNRTVWDPSNTAAADGACPTGTTLAGTYDFDQDCAGEDCFPEGSGAVDICELAAAYTTAGTTTLTADNVYILNTVAANGTLVGDGDAAGKTSAGGADPAVEHTLVIDAGTLILGDTADALAITRGSNIEANGTAADPIVMGSTTWFEAWIGGGDGVSEDSEWGGLVITGFGCANQCANATTCDATVEGYVSTFSWGGPQDCSENDDDSGNVNYMVIRNGGSEISPGDEINALTMFGVGYNTEISHVQTHKNFDDGFEFFGGSNVVTNAVATEVGDDSLDTDLGFVGGVQFGLVMQAQEGGRADRGHEMDSGTADAGTENSLPTFANVTIIGGTSATQGMDVGSGTGADFNNGIIVGNDRSCISFTNGTLGSTAGELSIDNYIINCPLGDSFEGAAPDTPATVEAWFNGGANNQEVDPRIGSWGFPSSPNRYFGPEYAFDPSTIANADIQSAFTATSYLGAFDQTVDPATGDWTEGWTIEVNGNRTVWDPSNTAAADGACPTGTTLAGTYDFDQDCAGEDCFPEGSGTVDICELAAAYTTAGTTTLTADNVYILNTVAANGTLVGDGDAAGKTSAGGADPAVEHTLVIDAGTLILGDTADALGITRGSNIEANGTAADPIVMGSTTWFEAWIGGGDGVAEDSEWGGLVITGFGCANQCANATTCDATVEGYVSTFSWGGPQDCSENDDDSGNVNYMVIRNGGSEISPGDEINALTMFGVGYNTEISHVQTHKNFDDGFEFFGGSNVVTNAVATEVGDDSLDTDLGFVGGVQFALVRQAQEGGRADRGHEMDSGTADAGTENSLPTFANITIIGGTSATQGMDVGSGTGADFNNGIIVGNDRSCISFTNGTLGSTGSELSIDGYAIACPLGASFEGSGGDTAGDVQAWFEANPDNLELMDIILSADGYPVPNN